MVPTTKKIMIYFILLLNCSMIYSVQTQSNKKVFYQEESYIECSYGIISNIIDDFEDCSFEIENEYYYVQCIYMKFNPPKKVIYHENQLKKYLASSYGQSPISVNILNSHLPESYVSLF